MEQNNSNDVIFNYEQEGITEQQANNRIEYLKNILTFEDTNYPLSKTIITHYLKELLNKEKETDQPFGYSVSRVINIFNNDPSFGLYGRLDYEGTNKVHMAHKYAPMHTYNSYKTFKYLFTSDLAETLAYDVLDFTIYLGDVNMFRICAPVTSSRRMVDLEYCFNFPSQTEEDIEKYGITYKEGLSYLCYYIVQGGIGTNYFKHHHEIILTLPKRVKNDPNDLINGGSKTHLDVIDKHIFNNRVEYLRYLSQLRDCYGTDDPTALGHENKVRFMDSLKDSILTCIG